MSIRVSRSAGRSRLLSAAGVLIAISTLILISAWPAAAQSRVSQKWSATFKDPVQAPYMTQLVMDSTADGNGGVAVAGDICTALNSSGRCGNEDFQIEDYNSTGQRVWSSSIGSAGGVAQASTIRVDSSGNIYAGGWEENANINGQVSYSLMVVKYSSSGTRDWIHYYGYYQNSSIAIVFPPVLAVDSQGNVYATARDSKMSGPASAVTVKFSPSGQLLWATPFTSITGYDGNSYTNFQPVAIAAYGSTDVYVTGSVYFGEHPVTIKYDAASGSLVWQRMADGAIASWGEPDSSPHSLALDSSGNVYEAGTGEDGHQSAYALKYDAEGDMLWLTVVPGSTCSGSGGPSNYPGEIAVDRNSNSFLSFQNCSTQLELAKFDSNGNVLWQKTYSNSGGERPADSYLNGADDIYILAGVPSINSGNQNADFLTLKYDGSGNLLWTIRYNNPDNSSTSIPVTMAAAGGDLYAAGMTGGVGSSGSPTSWVTLDYVQDAADATPTSLTFSSQVVDTTSSAQAVTLKNTSSGDLDIRGIDTSGPFSETNNCSSVIVAGGSCTIEVRFTPTSTGTLTGSLSISDQWAGSPDVVKLSGTGTP